MGYIPDMKIELSPSEEREFGKHLKNKRLHHVLKTILKSFVSFQKDKNQEKYHLLLGKLKRSCNENTMFLHHWGYARRRQNGMFIYMLFKHNKQAV